MEELKVLIEQRSGIINFENFEELKSQLNNYLEQYKGAVFTEESKKFAKDIVAELRRLKKSVNDRKIEVKKAFIQPYDEFEGKTKDLLALIDKPIELIDSQVKAFEEKRIEERRQVIRGIYNEKIGDLTEYAPLKKVYSDKWENASTSRKRIEEEMDQALLGIKMDVESLKLMRADGDIIKFALDKYKNGDTAIESMRKANEFAELMDQRKKAEEEAEKRRLAEEVKRQCREEIQRKVSEQMESVTAAWSPEPESDLLNEAGSELPFVTLSTHVAIYRMVASDRELSDLEMYMNSAGICFERKE